MQDLKKKTAMRLKAAQQDHREDQRACTTASSPTQDGYFQPYSQRYLPDRCVPGFLYSVPPNRGPSASQPQRTNLSSKKIQSKKVLTPNRQSAPQIQTKKLQQVRILKNDMVPSIHDESGLAENLTPPAEKNMPNSATRSGLSPITGNGRGRHAKAKHGQQQKEHHRQRHRQSHEQLVQPILTPNRSHKLPHGLTVQELKEMTKARLAAEAEGTEKVDTVTSESQRQVSLKQGHVMQSQQMQNPQISLPQQHHSNNTQVYQQQFAKLDISRGNSDSPSFSSMMSPRSRVNSESPSFSMMTSPRSRVNSESPSFSMTMTSPRGGMSSPLGGMHPQQQSRQSRIPASATWSHGMGHVSPSALSGEQHLYSHQQCISPMKHNQDKTSVLGTSSCAGKGHLQRSYQRPHNQQVQQRSEALETSSVTSQGSEYLGSERSFYLAPFRYNNNSTSSPFPSSSSNPTGNNALIGRSRSYPAGSNIGDALEPSSESFLKLNGNRNHHASFDAFLPPSSLFESSQIMPKNNASPLMVTDEDKAISSGDLSLPLFETNRLRNISVDDELPFCSRGSSPASTPFSFTLPSSVYQEENEQITKDQTTRPLPFNANFRTQSGHGDIPNWVAESVLVTPQRELRKVQIGEKPRVSPFSSDKQCPLSNKDSVFRATNAGGATEDFSPLSPQSSGCFLLPDVTLTGDRDGGSCSWAGGSTASTAGLYDSSSFGGLRSLTEDFENPLNLRPSSAPLFSEAEMISHRASISSPMNPVLHLSIAEKDEFVEERAKHGNMIGSPPSHNSSRHYRPDKWPEKNTKESHPPAY